MSTATTTAATTPFSSFAVLENNSTGLIQIFHATSRNGELQAHDFREEDADGRRMVPAEPVGWGEKPPGNARFFAAAGGYKSDFYNMYWTGWVEGQILTAVALTQENPITIPILPEDRLARPAVMGWDRKLKQYLARKTGAGFAIFKHEFSGEPGMPGKVDSVKILDLAYEPRHMVAQPVPIKFDMETGFEELGEAVLGWLSEQGGNLRAHVLWIKGREAALVESDPVAGYRPFPNQRIDLWTDLGGMVRMGWLMERADQDGIRSAEFVVDLAEETRSLIIRAGTVEGAKVHSAATVLSRINEPGAGTAFFLTRTGNLYKDYRGQTWKKIREGVPLTYDFPIFASAAQTYEAKADEAGAISFKAP